MIFTQRTHAVLMLAFFMICSESFAAEEKNDCEGFLCRYGEEINESQELRKLMNARVAKKIGFDLGKVSDMEIFKTVIDNFDVPESQNRSTDAVKVKYRLNSAGKIMGNEIFEGSTVDMFVIGEDVQLERIFSAKDFSWKPFPGNASTTYCLWTPENIQIMKGSKYKDLEVMEGVVQISPYHKWPGQIKKIVIASKDGRFKYRGKIYGKMSSIFLKPNGDIFSTAEIAGFVREAAEEKKRVTWMAENDEAGEHLCRYSRLQVPDDFYLVE